MRAQLVNLKDKSSQPTNHAQLVQGSRSWEGPPKLFYAMVGEYVFSSAHNFSLTLEFATFFCPSYYTTQKASVAPRIFAIRQVIQTNGLASSLSAITKAKGVWAIMP